MYVKARERVPHPALLIELAYPPSPVVMRALHVRACALTCGVRLLSCVSCAYHKFTLYSDDVGDPPSAACPEVGHGADMASSSLQEALLLLATMFVTT